MPANPPTDPAIPFGLRVFTTFGFLAIGATVAVGAFAIGYPWGALVALPSLAGVVWAWFGARDAT